MDPGEQTTGTRDEHYNLVSVLYHALHGAETTEAYILDAEAAGDERLADFFREAQATQRELAERAKGMLGIVKQAPSAGGVTGAAGGAAMLDDTVPHESEVPPDTEPVDVRGRAAPGVGFPPEDVSSPRTSPEGAVPGTWRRGRRRTSRPLRPTCRQTLGWESHPNARLAQTRQAPHRSRTKFRRAPRPKPRLGTCRGEPRRSARRRGSRTRKSARCRPIGHPKGKPWANLAVPRASSKRPGGPGESKNRKTKAL